MKQIVLVLSKRLRHRIAKKYLNAAITMVGLLLLSIASPQTAAADPIISTQDPYQAPAFIGTEATANPLPSQPLHEPILFGLHADAGNTKVYSSSGPLGISPVVTSVLSPGLAPLLFDGEGRLNAGSMVLTESGTYRQCVVAADPDTLDILAHWFAPEGQTINFSYAVQKPYGPLLITSKEGHIYLLNRSDDNDSPSFSVSQSYDLQSLGVLNGELPLLCATFDIYGNIWFTTGGIIGVGDDPGTKTILGYIEPDGTSHWMTLANQIVENGIAVHESRVFVLTGPAGDADTASAKGYVYAFTATEDGIKILWQDDYDAGSSIKPGGFARGSGSTPTLIDDKYLAFTDNADSQINLHIYRQQPLRKQRVCSVPLFDAGASANDIGMIGVKSESTIGLVVLNDYNAPSVYTQQADSEDHSMASMAPGVSLIEYDESTRGKCITRWSIPLRIKSVPVVSTETGLIYGYTQDPDLAAEGEYVWYFTAIDYRTGEVVWRIRSGAGFTYNDGFRGATLGPDGTLYQGLTYGTVMLRDGDEN